ncbi:MAG: protein kinase [Gemmatimonadales bacterium]
MSSRCPRCGATYDDGSKFCRNDGSPLSVDSGGAVGEGGSGTTIRRAVRPDKPATDPAGTLAQQTLDGRYEIMGKIGEGGMAFVYEAKELNSGKSVAVKVISPNLAKDDTTIERLRREAGLAMRLEHPNVCQILRLGETEDGLIYVVMPYLKGELLSDYEYRVGPMALEKSVTFIVQICAGLNHAHLLNIVHRDLKPENVMIVRSDGGTEDDEYAIVMDFGLAKENRTDPGVQKLTATGIILGTPEFMSPEQIRGQTLDGRSDVYAVGIMAFEMFTGKLPFEGRNAQEMMIARLRGKPIPLTQYRSDLPAGVETVLLKSMATDPADRQQGVLQLGMELLENVEASLAQKLSGYIF